MYMRLGDAPLPDLVKYTGSWYSYGVVRNTASETFFADTAGVSDYLGVKVQISLDGTITETYCGKKKSGTWSIENGIFIATGLYHDFVFGTGGILLCDLGNDCFLACDRSEPESSSKVAVLPQNLKIIEEEAFSGTGFNTIIIPDSCQTIAKNAFSKALELSVIYIPDSVITIEGEVFANTKEILIICESNNSAAAYARKNGIHYVVKNR